MTSTDALDLLHWLHERKASALLDSAHYRDSAHDLKMAQATEYKAVAFQEVIDKITRQFV